MDIRLGERYKLSVFVFDLIDANLKSDWEVLEDYDENRIGHAFVEFFLLLLVGG